MGFEVIHEEIDFFTENEGEIIISNPPYSCKVKVFERLKKPETFRNFNMKDITYQVDYTIKNPSPKEWHALKRMPKKNKLI
jgi:bifunctional pyridoxal-dependent enzyme with beta-cystathionase and maltose regulon repressor activities